MTAAHTQQKTSSHRMTPRQRLSLLIDQARVDLEASDHAAKIAVYKQLLSNLEAIAFRGRST